MIETAIPKLWITVDEKPYLVATVQGKPEMIRAGSTCQHLWQDQEGQYDRMLGVVYCSKCMKRLRPGLVRKMMEEK